MNEQLAQVHDRIVQVKNLIIGGCCKIIVAGPCAVESEEQVEQAAVVLSQLGIPIMRGGAYKPRSSPHSFQGLGRGGLDMLVAAAHRHGLLTVSEVIDTRDVDFCASRVDILQIGSRNMHNSPLLREVGRSGKPVLLKRGFMATVEELLFAAEYVLDEGNRNVILCERGIRTFETFTRNTLDLSCVALVKRMQPMPIIVDLSHSLGRTDIMLPMARAALACGCDGLMVEIHPNPSKALCDGNQSLSFQEFGKLVRALQPLLRFLEEQA